MLEPSLQTHCARERARLVRLNVSLPQPIGRHGPPGSRHGLLSLHQDCTQMAQILHRRFGTTELRLGLYVRVKSGLYSHTRNLAPETRMFAALLRGVFPESPFLAMALLYDPNMGLHKDAQNDWVPSLIIELQSSDSGGTWIQDDQGQAAVESDKGSFLWGTVMTGCYKISSRTTLHCSVPGDSPRLVLVAWTPAGWETIRVPLQDELRQLGFRVSYCRRESASDAQPLVQQSLSSAVSAAHRDQAHTRRHTSSWSSISPRRVATGDPTGAVGSVPRSARRP